MKLNKKGFTLIDLLAVVVILLAISVMAISSISAAIERNKVKINDTNDTWKTNMSGFGIRVDHHFTISLKNNRGKVDKKIRCAMKDGCFLMQALAKDYRGKWIMFRIHGGSISNKFEVGTNLLDFLKRIKEANDNNDLLEHDSLLMHIFNNLNDV